MLLRAYSIPLVDLAANSGLTWSDPTAIARHATEGEAPYIVSVRLELSEIDEEAR